MRVIRSRMNGGLRRRGHAAVLTAVCMVPLLGMAALAIDIGMIQNARGDLQVAADSAALAGAWQLLDPERLNGKPDMNEESDAARVEAVARAAQNPVLTASPVVDPNYTNDQGGDVVIGYLDDIENPNATLSFVDPNQANSVQVTVHRDSTRNGPLILSFARALGFDQIELAATATATFKDGTVGFRVTEETGNADIIPFALHIDSWNALLDGSKNNGDNYKYDEETGVVSAGSDGINELNLYPGAGAGQLPSGNFGTIDIGNPNNSTAELSRQITDGINADDLAWHGGELKLGADGTLILTGDTGLSAGIKDDLESIKGEPRTIVLFNSVSGNGNNAEYTIVGFAGIRIMNVLLTGKMSKKNVMIQPAYVVDDSAITEAGSGPSYFVYQPVILVR